MPERPEGLEALATLLQDLGRRDGRCHGRPLRRLGCVMEELDPTLDYLLVGEHGMA